MSKEIQFPHVTVGSIFENDSSFFQVVRRSGNTIYTRQIKGKAVAWTGMKAEEWIPFPNDFRYEKIHRSKIKSYDINNIEVVTEIDHLYCTLRLN